MASYKQTNVSSRDEDETYAYAMQLVLGSVLPMALGSANELGLFEIISEAGPEAKLSASEITNKLVDCMNPSAPMMVDRILRVLATHNVIGCSVIGSERFYGLVSVSKYFVNNQDGVSLAPLMALVQDKVFLDSWSQLKDAVLEGGVPFDRVHGSHAFEYPSLDARFNQVFNKAMYNQTTIIINNILQHYNGFEQLKELVDVGGGLGVTLHLITSKHPHIKGINFDLPHVVQHASPYPGVEHVGGDMFESVPKSEAIFMKWILHDWSDERCLIILKNCHNALPKDGKVIVVDAILSIEVEMSSAVRAIAQTDVLMMTQNPGGKERTKEEFMALANKAGFRDVEFKCFVCSFWVMEFLK